MLAGKFTPLQRISLHRLNDSEIMPDAHRTEPHIEIGKANPEQTQPRPKHVTPIETSHAGVGAIACGRSGKLIEKAAGQMPQ